MIVISMRAPFGASCCRVPQRMLPSQLANVGGQMLVTKRLRLREWRKADKPLLAEIHSDPEVMRFLGGVKTFDETSEVIDLIGGMFRAGEPSLWAAERIEDEKLIGWIGLHQLGPEYPFGPALEAAWRLGRSFWGQGYAIEGVGAALNYAFDVLDAPRVFAFTALANQRSERLMLRLGMKKVEGGDFAHPDFSATDPQSIHVL